MRVRRLNGNWRGEDFFFFKVWKGGRCNLRFGKYLFGINIEIYRFGEI